MKKTITILILIFLIIVLVFTLFIREGINLNKLKKSTESRLDNSRSYNLTLTAFIINYYTLWQHFQVFTWEYQKQTKLLKDLEVQNEIISSAIDNNFIIRAWEKYEVTAYSPLECGSVTSIGFNLTQPWTRYFNIAAVDPKIIPYGSILLINIDGEIKIYLAADTGGMIKGKKIDLYFNDYNNAKNFGRRHNTPVQVIIPGQVNGL